MATDETKILINTLKIFYIYKTNISAESTIFEVN